MIVRHLVTLGLAAAVASCGAGEPPTEGTPDASPSQTEVEVEGPSPSASETQVTPTPSEGDPATHTPGPATPPTPSEAPISTPSEAPISTPSEAPLSTPSEAPSPTPTPVADSGPDRYFPDEDGDGFGDLLRGLPWDPGGWITVTGDCDDGAPDVHAGAPDLPGDGVDSDCGGHDGPDPHVGLGEGSGDDLWEAVYDAEDGATVWVGPGTWAIAGMIVSGKSLALRGTHGRDRTTLDAQGLDRHLLLLAEDGAPRWELSRLTLLNGHTEQPYFSESDFRGGSVLTVGGQLFVDDCTFSSNHSEELWDWRRIGGGAIASTDTSLTLRDSLFSGNRGGAAGGALSIIRGDLLAQRVRFEGNSAYEVASESQPVADGGGLQAQDATITLVDVEVEGDHVVGDGGFAWLLRCQTDVERLQLTHTWAAGVVGDAGQEDYPWAPSHGGAFYVKGGELQLKASALSSAEADEGGIIYGDGASLILQDAQLSAGRTHEYVDKECPYYEAGFGCAYDTVTTSHYGRGGLIRGVSCEGSADSTSFSDGTAEGEGGALSWDGGSLQLSGLEITESHAGKSGGGIYSAGATVTLSRVRLSSNASGGSGGGIACQTGPVTMRGVDIVKNQATKDGGGIWASRAGLSLSAVFLNGNDASQGLALRGTELRASLMEHLTVVENLGYGTAVVITNTEDEIALTRSILAYNTTKSSTPGDDFYSDTALYDPKAIYSGGYPPGTTYVDPGFVRLNLYSSVGDDYHLRPTSPLKDYQGSGTELGAFGGPWADTSYYDDGDADGLYDGWEAAFGLDPTRDDAGEDPDHDGLSNRKELDAGTDPHQPDTDGDGVNDGREVATGRDPNVRDE